ncbi:MAG: hypothetical protein KDA42_07165 [Planctomycetales bacterium]|nr:hypothetical protein [Planctomycetales bacterium]
MSGNAPVLEEDLDLVEASVVTGDETASLLNRAQFDDAVQESAREVVTGPACENCGHPFETQAATVCQRCGYYAMLGTFVEVDPWEEESNALQAAPAPKSHWEVWSELLAGFIQRLPRWAWILAFCVAVVIVESVVARLATPATGTVRTYWSVTQLAVGASIFAICHIFVYVMAAMKHDKFGLIDVVLSPLGLWTDAFSRMPKTQIPVISGAASFTAVVMSLLVIGAIPYERLLDWGIEPPPKQNLMKAVIAEAKKAKAKAQSLEEAVSDFAGEAGDLESEPEPPKEIRTVHLECVIVGFRVEKDNPKKIASLILAAERGSGLGVVGSVGFDVAPEREAELTRQLFASERKRPFVTTNKIGRWVDPKFICKVSCVKQSASGQIIDPILDDVSAEFDFGL